MAVVGRHRFNFLLADDSLGFGNDRRHSSEPMRMRLY
jgi:hypothetical protein